MDTWKTEFLKQYAETGQIGTALKSIPDAPSTGSFMHVAGDDPEFWRQFRLAQEGRALDILTKMEAANENGNTENGDLALYQMLVNILTNDFSGVDMLVKSRAPGTLKRTPEMEGITLEIAEWLELIGHKVAVRE